MPQSNYMTTYLATYPIWCVAQKPSGVTVSSVLMAKAVPNKHVFAAGSLQIATVVETDEEGHIETVSQEVTVTPPAEEVAAEQPDEEEVEEEEEEEPPHHSGGRRKTRR